MEKKNYGILLIMVSVIVALVYTIWVPLSYLLTDGKETVLLKEILPSPIWGLIIPIYLLILITVFLFGWIGVKIINSIVDNNFNLLSSQQKHKGAKL